VDYALSGSILQFAKLNPARTPDSKSCNGALSAYFVYYRYFVW